jgi:hypothetical protein
MATATKIPTDFSAAAEHVSDLNERLVNAGKRASSRYLDGYEKLVENVTSFQQKLADQSRNGTVQSVVKTQVDLTRQLTAAYTSAAREFIA